MKTIFAAILLAALSCAAFCANTVVTDSSGNLLAPTAGTFRTQNGIQAHSTVLDDLAGLANAQGKLVNNGSGLLSYSKDGELFAYRSAKSASFSVGTDPKGQVYTVTSGSSVITATLPAASNQWYGWFHKVDTSSTGRMNTSPVTLNLLNANQMLFVWSDGTTYHASVLQGEDLKNSGTLKTPTLVSPIVQTPSISSPTVTGDTTFSSGGNVNIAGTLTMSNNPIGQITFSNSAVAQFSASGVFDIQDSLQNFMEFAGTLAGGPQISFGTNLFLNGNTFNIDGFSYFYGDNAGDVYFTTPGIAYFNNTVGAGSGFQGDGYYITGLNADNMTNGTLGTAYGGTGKNSFTEGTDYMSPAYFWPGATSVSQTANSIVTSGGSGHYAFFRLAAFSAHATGAADQTSPVIGYASGVGSITVMQGIASQFYSAIIDANAAAGVANTLPNGGSSPLVYYPGAPYIVLSGSITVSAGDVLTDAHGASAIVYANHTGTDPSLQWMTGTKWFTLGDTIVKNGTSLTGTTITDTGPLPSGENNRQILFRGRHLVSDPVVWCIWNDTTTNSSGATIEVKQ